MDKPGLRQLLLIPLSTLLALVAVLLLGKAPDWVVLLTLLVCALGFYLLVWGKAHRDFRRLGQYLDDLGPHAPANPVPSMGLEEFEDLSRALDAARDRLASALGHLAVHREELRLVLASIGDALWSQNYDGELEWGNEPFRALFPVFDPNNRQKYWEVIRDHDLLNALESLSGEPSRQITDIQIQGRAYLLSVSRNDQSRRRVCILHDIDAIRQTHQMKKDFIINLAHELRTPLTAIKGFSEAMQASPDGDHTRHLRIIHSHTERLIRLIRDLEQLIRLESAATLELQEINLHTFLDNIRLILEPELEARGLWLRIGLDPARPRLVCDPFRLEQVFLNLAQNALRYTESGGISIRSLACGEDTVFEVTDTGRGIAAEHLPRVFERFYVADPSRNKSLSGTGLGLAIVKHIVLLHQGAIVAESEPGRGSTFRFTLPSLSLPERRDHD